MRAVNGGIPCGNPKGNKTMKRLILIPLTLAGLLSVNLISRAAEGKDDKKPSAPEKKETKPFKNADVVEFDKLRTDKKNVVLDVRTKKEFDSGHIPGAVNIDVNAPDFDENVARLDKSKTYLVHCGAGVRSVKACEKMGKLEFPKLVNLEGGFKAWEKAGKPVEK
jgi:phage shock protein E